MSGPEIFFDPNRYDHLPLCEQMGLHDRLSVQVENARFALEAAESELALVALAIAKNLPPRKPIDDPEHI